MSPEEPSDPKESIRPCCFTSLIQLHVFRLLQRGLHPGKPLIHMPTKIPKPTERFCQLHCNLCDFVVLALDSPPEQFSKVIMFNADLIQPPLSSPTFQIRLILLCQLKEEVSMAQS